MKILGKELTFNGNKVYHAGSKPTISEIGAAASSHTHNYAGSSSAGGAANSANTLATARTINGTSFNGSANITTANWGTSRTLTIGNTGKSVNGSGNVSWSLAEIGAAAASHTHAYAPTSTGSSISIHADSDSSSTSEYLLLKAGHNELKITSSAGGTTVTKGQDKLTFNGNVVYHTGKKPTPADIGAAASSHTHNYAGSSSAGGAANSANTLATARTINGTSFNGSANITTANWGTARIITIGSTGKSVNGSGSVTWTLREIGAAASNHTHGLVDLNSEAFSGGNDLNTYNSTKTWVARTINSTTNKPADYFTVVNFGANSNSNFQLAHSYANNSTLYVRGRHDTSGDYTPWAKIYTDKNKPTASEIGAAAASHTHSYLPLSGGTVTGNIVPNGAYNLGSQSNQWVDVYIRGSLINNVAGRSEGYFAFSNGSQFATAIYGKANGEIGIYDSLRSRHVFMYTFENNKFLLTFSNSLKPSAGNAFDLGDDGHRWRTVYAVNVLTTSDENHKENIEYIKENTEYASNETTKDNSITYEDMYNFYKDIKLATYNYKKQEHQEFGFIAQDISKTKVGSQIALNSEDGYMYSVGSYISSVAGALKQCINEIELLKEINKELHEEIYTLKNEL